MSTAARRGISLSLIMGFLAPLCIVIEPKTPVIPNASAASSSDNILITGPLSSTPTGVAITNVDETFTAELKATAQAAWPNSQFPDYTLEVSDLDGDIAATTVGTTITFDTDAAGRMWHVDLGTDPTGDPDAGVDLVTVLAHELGHVLGLPDLDALDASDDLMFESI